MVNLTKAPYWLDRDPVHFPPTKLAMDEPDGLLAIGGDLTPEWLLHAYSVGLFPWFNPGEPVLWWTPNPRSVLPLANLKIRKSLWKKIKQKAKDKGFEVTLDRDFNNVIKACSETPRKDQEGTWITDEMLTAYNTLHIQGYAHSVEVWQDNDLVGGLYGVSLGKMFFGESMFARQTDASKIALIALSMQLKEWGFTLIDTQVETGHLNSMGAIHLSREEFEKQMRSQSALDFPNRKWSFEIDWISATNDYYLQKKNP